MAALGSLWESIIGFDLHGSFINSNGGVSSYSLAGLNAGATLRFMATSTRDILTVYVRWGTVTAAGTVELRIETIDATTGKPTGTLYDAAATKSFTPVAGWQAVTFDVAPTTGLTAGSEYGIVLLTTVAGTAHPLQYTTLSGFVSKLPCRILTAADGTTRSNFAEVAGGACPIASIVYEDSVEELNVFCGTATHTSRLVHGTNAVAAKIVVPANVTWSVDGVCASVVKTGTPAGDLRVRIFDSGDSVVAGSTVTIDKDSLSALSTASAIRLQFPGVVSLTAGTYRIVFDSSSSANSSNCWNIKSSVYRSSATVPSGWNVSTTTDVTGGPISWSDVNTDRPLIGLILDTMSSGGGGGGGMPHLQLGKVGFA